MVRSTIHENGRLLGLGSGLIVVVVGIGGLGAIGSVLGSGLGGLWLVLASGSAGGEFLHMDA